MRISTDKAFHRNDLTIYDQLECWWDPQDRSLAPLRRLVPARMKYLEQSPLWQGGRVIDVGCGGGYMAEALSRTGADVTGVDIAPGAIAAAVRRAQDENLNINYRLADAQALPFADNEFDAAVCTDVLVHVPDPACVVRELTRVVRPGGQIYYSAINRTVLASLVMITLGEDLLRLIPKGTHDPKKFLRPQEIGRWFTENGSIPGGCTGIGPIGWSGGPVFGEHPIRAVMYQGLATCGQRQPKALPQ